MSCIGALGDVVLYRPKNRLIEVVLLFNVNEGIIDEVGILCSAACACAVLEIVTEGIYIAVLIAVTAGAGVGGVALFRAGRRSYYCENTSMLK